MPGPAGNRQNLDSVVAPTSQSPNAGCVHLRKKCLIPPFPLISQLAPSHLHLKGYKHLSQKQKIEAINKWILDSYKASLGRKQNNSV